MTLCGSQLVFAAGVCRSKIGKKITEKVVKMCRRMSVDSAVAAAAHHHQVFP